MSGIPQHGIETVHVVSLGGSYFYLDSFHTIFSSPPAPFCLLTQDTYGLDDKLRFLVIRRFIWENISKTG